MAIKKFNCKENGQYMEGKVGQKKAFVQFIKDDRNNGMFVGWCKWFGGEGRIANMSQGAGMTAAMSVTEWEGIRSSAYV